MRWVRYEPRRDSMTMSNTAQQAREEAGTVAGSVKDETKQLAQQASEQPRTVMRQVQDDVRSRANQEADKIAETLRSASRQLSSMASTSDEQSGFLPAVAREGANAMERIPGRLDVGGFDALFADLRGWARRNPGTFALGAITAGFVAGRVVRNASSQARSNGAGSDAMGSYGMGSYGLDSDMTQGA